MSLYDRFELLDLERDDGVKSFEAREIATGRPVKVHLFVHPDAPIQAALLKAIDRLPESERPHVIARGKHEGTPFLVTDRLAPYPGLSEWVQAAHRAAIRTAQPKKSTLETAGAWKLPPVPAPQPVTAPPVEPAASVNRQFAELFPTGERPIIPLDKLQPPPVAKTAPPQSTREPGEFTRMFQAPAAPVPPQAPPPAAKEPGEFTRMFQTSPAPPSTSPGPPQAPPPASPQKSGPGDFARFFESSSPAGPLPQNPAVQRPLAPQAPGSSGPNRVGEFTRSFGKGEIPVAPPPAAAPPPVPKEPGEFTRMFQSPGGSAPPSSPSPSLTSPTVQPARPPVAPPAMPAAAPKQTGPGEYTRQFAAPAQLTFGQPSATPSPTGPAAPPATFAPQPPMGQAPARPKSNLPLILGIVGIVVLAALIIVFFAMRPK